MSNLVFDPTKLAVSCEENDIGVVGMEMSSIKCVLCKSFACRHVNLVNKLHNFDSSVPVCIAELMERKEITKPKRAATVSSKLAIDFLVKSSEKAQLRSSPDQYLEKIVFEGKEMLVLEGDFWKQECAGGGEHIVDASENSQYKLMKLYTRDSTFSCICKYSAILSAVYL